MSNRLKHNLKCIILYATITYIILLPFKLYVLSICISLLLGFFFGFLNDIITQLRKLNGEVFDNVDEDVVIDDITKRDGIQIDNLNIRLQMNISQKEFKVKYIVPVGKCPWWDFWHNKKRNIDIVISDLDNTDLVSSEDFFIPSNDKY